MKYKIYSEMVDKIPYEERKEGSKEVCWRYSHNPIVKRNPIDGIARIFNSAVVPYNGEFIGVFRVEDASSLPHLRLAHSKDGLNFTVEESVYVEISNEFSGISKTILVEFSRGFKSIEFNCIDYVFIGKTLNLSVSISPSAFSNETVGYIIPEE